MCQCTQSLILAGTRAWQAQENLGSCYSLVNFTFTPGSQPGLIPDTSSLASRLSLGSVFAAAGRGKASAVAVARPGLSMCHLWPWGKSLREALGHATCHLTCTLICILLASLALFSLLKIVFSQFKCLLSSGQAQVTPLCPQLSRPRSSDAFTSPISSGRRVESLSVSAIG